MMGTSRHTNLRIVGVWVLAAAGLLATGVAGQTTGSLTGRAAVDALTEDGGPGEPRVGVGPRDLPRDPGVGGDGRRGLLGLRLLFRRQPANFRFKFLFCHFAARLK